MNNDVSVPLRTVADHPELHLEVVPETLRPGALDQPVRWAHVSELRDPAPYLLGDELLLTAGVNLPGSRAAVDEYVRGLAAAGITALGFGVTPPMHHELPVRLRHACARHQLPLLVVPTRTPFLAISRAVSVALAEASQREQRRVAEAREALTRAAAGGVREVVRGLARRLSGWVALVGRDDEPTAEDGAPRPLPAEVGGILARLRAGTGIRSATTELPGPTFVVAQPVYPQATAAHLLVVGRGERFGSTDRAIVAVGAALLGLAAHAGTDTARLGAATTALLTGSAQADALSALLPSAEYRVVAGVRRDGTGEEEPGYEWLHSLLRTPLVRVTGGRFTAIATAAPDPDTTAALAAQGWLVVTASPLPAGRLAEAESELRTLLERARALGRPVTAEPGQGLSSVVPPEAAARHARRLLAPLRERGDDVLVTTLRTWLACHGGWDRTAAALGVHRNSVRHRIGQAERALKLDLSDPDARMELWFALRWAET
ncbi:PucR family transcriptional regulator [Prauserella muralis]|uniref:PucR family transcriptional regulator n=1 Tax=Prauserella muralis TaxID=588067 RepID=A0A2V4B1U1_9PSEU|nr:PucR family transcriptional regulator [Prauserella muralis]PXY28174.1 PucR family transcriptional regulator [Prauserella muralis]